MSYTFFALSELTVLAGPLLAAAESGVGGLAKYEQPWRPPEWSKPALTMITVPGTSAPALPASGTDIFGQPLPGVAAFQGEPTRYLVFDAVFRVEHSRDLRLTEHPIQTSASSPVSSITDHAYRMPGRVRLEIGMSDAMQSYASDMWTGKASKSVAAYQTLVDLQQQRRLVTLTTRLETYQHMIIDRISPTDDAKTAHGLRATVSLREVFLAPLSASEIAGISSASTAPANPSGKVSGTLVYGGGATSVDDNGNVTYSARSQTTGATPMGTQQPMPVSDSLSQQHSVTTPIPNISSTIPGAGNWSSNNVSTLGGLFG